LLRHAVARAYMLATSIATILGSVWFERNHRKERNVREKW